MSKLSNPFSFPSRQVSTTVYSDLRAALEDQFVEIDSEVESFIDSVQPHLLTIETFNDSGPRILCLLRGDSETLWHEIEVAMPTCFLSQPVIVIKRGPNLMHLPTSN